MKLKFLVLFFCVFTWKIASQNTIKHYTKAPLKEVLSVLENKLKVKFSYPDKLVLNKTISIEIGNGDLKLFLEKLHKKTGLFFQKITNRYVIVLEKNKKKGTTFFGLILDKKTKEPLVGASVVNIQQYSGVNTDDLGYFQLEDVEKKNSIKISFLGYNARIIPIKKLLEKKVSVIYLSETTSLLEEVFIADYLADGIVKNTDGSINILPKKVKILPGLTEPDVLQSIQLLPGINSPNETASGIQVRGGASDQNLVLFDGIKMYNSGHLFGMISAFNPYITKKIKIYKSATSVEYGNHISGVIDIETDNELPTKFSGGFGFNLTHADVYVKEKISNKIGVSFSARRSFTDFINTSTFNRLSEKAFQNTQISRDNNDVNNDVLLKNNTNFHFIDYNTKLIYKPSKKDKITFNQLFIKNELDYEFYLIDRSYETRDVLKIKNEGFNTSWERKWNDKTVYKTKLHYSFFDLGYNYNGSQNLGKIWTQKSIKNNTIRDIGFSTKVNKEITKSTSFNVGYEYTNNRVSYNLERSYTNAPQFDYKIGENDNNNLHAIFGEYVYKKGSHFSLHAGLRGSYLSLIKKTFLTPRIHTQFRVLPKFWIKTSLELKQQNISQLLEVSTLDFGLENKVWALANNKNLPLLKSNQVTIGATFKDNYWVLDIEAYKKNTSGLTSITKGFSTSAQNFSIGDGSSIGLDLLVKKKWRNYNTWFSYSFSKSDFTFPEINNGNKFNGNFDITHSLLVSHNLKLGNYNFSLGWNYRTGIPYTKAIGISQTNQPIYESINNSRLPNYHKLDFSTTYTFQMNKKGNLRGKIGFSLLNIYNKKNVLERKFDIKLDKKLNKFVIGTVDNISLGFTPNIVFRIRF